MDRCICWLIRWILVRPRRRRVYLVNSRLEKEDALKRADRAANGI